ncbi:MAG TPA: Fur family transcriptional regulator [Anaerolineaceae bacterium]
MNTAENIIQWMNMLTERGCRQTDARRKIIEVILTTSRAMEPFEIFEIGRKQYPGLGLVTVYRTLEKLESLHLVQRVHQPGGCNMYIRAASGHEHLLICTSCGQAVYFSGDDLTQFMSTVGSQFGYQVSDHWLQLFGTCQNCQAQMQREALSKSTEEVECGKKSG